MDSEVEPWNNSYEIHGEVERLLRRLLEGNLTDENGWVGRRGEWWRIGEDGRQLLEQGGFKLR